MTTKDDTVVITQLQVDVGVIKSDVKAGQAETARRLTNIEGKIDNFAFAKQVDLEDLAKDLRDNYMRKESLRWVQYVVGGIAVGVGVAIVIGVLKLLGASL